MSLIQKQRYRGIDVKAWIKVKLECDFGHTFLPADAEGVFILGMCLIYKLTVDHEKKHGPLGKDQDEVKQRLGRRQMDQEANKKTNSNQPAPSVQRSITGTARFIEKSYLTHKF